MDKRQFTEKFDAPRASQGLRADRLCSFLRGYAVTINDHTFEEAADLIDELLGEVTEGREFAAAVPAPGAPGALSKEETLARVRAAAEAAAKPKPFGPNIPRRI